MKVEKNLIGFMRTTEVTVNKKDGSYNQHMHVLLCVSNDYFRSKDNYITQKEWLSLWQKALKVDYKPVANIKAIKPNKKVILIFKQQLKKHQSIQLKHLII